MNKKDPSKLKVLVGSMILAIAIFLGYLAFSPDNKDAINSRSTTNTYLNNGNQETFMERNSRELSKSALFGWKGTDLGHSNSFLFNDKGDVWILKRVSKDFVYNDTVKVHKTSKGWEINNGYVTYLVNKMDELEAYEDNKIIATYKPFNDGKTP